MQEAYQRARRLWVSIQRLRARTGSDRRDLRNELECVLELVGWTYDDVLRSVPVSDDIPNYSRRSSRWIREFNGPRRLKLITLRPLEYADVEFIKNLNKKRRKQSELN